MGGEGHGVETTATEHQAGGSRLTAHDTPHIVTIPLPPARRSFLMADRDFALPNSTSRLLVELLSIHPTNSALPSI